MWLYILAAVCSAIAFIILFFSSFEAVTKEMPSPYIKQLIAGWWFFGGVTILMLALAPIINIFELRSIPVTDDVEPASEVESPPDTVL